MFLTKGCEIKDGKLHIGGLSAEALAKEYGTPLYVMNEDIIREKCREFKVAFAKHFGEKAKPFFASKAFCCKEIYRIMKAEGLGTDVVSGGELYTALAVGFPACDIILHGNNKQESELAYAVESGVGFICVDNLPELLMVERIAREKGRTQGILFRVKPGVEAHTHEFIKTGQIDSKFGFSLDEAKEAIEMAQKLNSIKLRGIHIHIGSQIFESEPFAEAAEIVLRLCGEISYTPEILNIGGGFGIDYTAKDDTPNLDGQIEVTAERIKSTCAELSMPVPFIISEPGRAIVGEAGTTLYKIGAVKEIKDIRTYVSVDGGMTDNPRYVLYGSEYTFINASRADDSADKLVTIAGKCCESGDLLGKDVTIADSSRVGDTLAVLCTGAYNYSMACHYNRTPKATVVMVSNGSARVVVRREGYEDLARHDI